jgi:hypothetical protein
MSEVTFRCFIPQRYEQPVEVQATEAHKAAEQFASWQPYVPGLLYCEVGVITPTDQRLRFQVRIRIELHYDAQRLAKCERCDEWAHADWEGNVWKPGHAHRCDENIKRRENPSEYEY